MLLPSPSLWTATYGESLMLIITWWWGRRVMQYRSGSVKVYGKFLPLYVTDLLISAGYTSLISWLLLKCAFNVHIYGPFWCILTYHVSSTLPFTPQRVLRNMWYRAYKQLQTPCLQNIIPRIQNKPMRTHSWSPWLLWSAGTQHGKTHCLFNGTALS